MSESARHKPSARAALETLVLTAAVPVVGWSLDRHEPFFLHHAFSWLAFVPLLIGLRHGLMLGCGSALLLDAALVFAWRTRALGVTTFPGEVLVALVALAVLAGQFSDVWRRECKRLDSGLDSMRQQLDQVSRAHFLLELSHDRLEERECDAPNLREALAAVRDLAGDLRGNWEPLAPRVLDIFAAYCTVESASLHSVTAGGTLVEPPVAVLGRPHTVSPSDPLLRDALTARHLTYLPTATRPTGSASSSLLVAVPLVDPGRRTRAVLCVESLPFMAFHQRNLETIATLAEHFADLVWGTARDMKRRRRREFESRLSSALQGVQTAKTSLVVAALHVRRGSPISDIVSTVLGASLRDVDVPFVARDSGGNHLVSMLLPSADKVTALALEERITGIVRQELNLPLDRAGAAFAFYVPGQRDTVPGVMRIVAQKAHVDENSLDRFLVG